MSEFDSEEIEINQYSGQTNGALAEWILCTGVKSRRSWFNSTGHHRNDKCKMKKNGTGTTAMEEIKR